MLDRFSSTVERIYAAAVDASLWEDALRGIEEFCGSTGAVLNLVPKTETAVPQCRAGSFSDSDCAEYSRDYMWRCPRIAFARDNPQTPLHFDSLILSESEMDRDPTYHWFGTHGLRYFVASWTGETADHLAYMTVQRSRRQGHANEQQLEQFSLIAAHCRQAINLAAKLGSFSGINLVSSAAIQSMRHAALVVTREGMVLLANRQAEALSMARDGIMMSGRRFRCNLIGDQDSLDRLLQSATDADQRGRRGGWTRIRRRSGRPALQVFVAPYVDGLNAELRRDPHALVIIGDPLKLPAIEESALRDLFALTGSEARLACAIGGGHSLESAAALLGMKITTARSHLKSIFAKVGVNRQQDLIRTLTALPSVDGNT